MHFVPEFRAGEPAAGGPPKSCCCAISIATPAKNTMQCRSGLHRRFVLLHVLGARVCRKPQGQTLAAFVNTAAIAGNCGCRSQLYRKIGLEG